MIGAQGISLSERIIYVQIRVVKKNPAKHHFYVAHPHVVRQSVSAGDRTASDLKVRFHNNPHEGVPAVYVAANPKKELAVIKAKVGDGNFDFARLGNMEHVKTGLPAYTIGQPAKDWGVTYTPGPSAMSALFGLRSSRPTFSTGIPVERSSISGAASSV
jgi:S1-C subfamily serine protease